MNVEASGWRRQALDGEIVDEGALAERRRGRRRILIIAAVLIALAIVAVLMFSGGDENAAPPAGTAAGGPGQTLPRVTVIVPGREQVSRTISATGNLAARRDMPVGVAGEGGMVSRVLVEAGQWVGAGQTLATIDRSVQAQEASQLTAAIEVARADAALAQSELNRARALVARGFISQADIDRKTATLNAANARVRVAQAQLGQTRARIGRLDIKAPAAGLVLTRSVEPGQVVSAGSGALFRIARGGEMELLARLPQDDLSRLKPGVPATVTPVGSSETVQGQIWQVSPVIDPQTRQGEARILVPYSPSMRPGGFASATITAGSVDAPLLPESAVQNDAKGSYVFIVGADNVLQRRDVQVMSVTDNGVIIGGGLNGTERVVQSAGAFVNPGEKVVPVRASARR